MLCYQLSWATKRRFYIYMSNWIVDVFTYNLTKSAPWWVHVALRRERPEVVHSLDQLDFLQLLNHDSNLIDSVKENNNMIIKNKHETITHFSALNTTNYGKSYRGHGNCKFGSDNSEETLKTLTLGLPRFTRDSRTSTLEPWLEGKPISQNSHWDIFYFSRTLLYLFIFF